jgi:glycerol-3-phosphate O-acyltransferase / dihydroxyacetone phosphate acyltransferase
MLLRLFYYFLKVLCPILVHIYYRITFLQQAHFKLPKGACIMTSNHPNTLIDVMMSVPFVNRKSHFLANAGLFKKPFFDWLWRTLWCIPIKRRQDNVAHIDNDDSFAACDAFLTKGGLLFIAPEGTSFNERHVRAFKPGTARIAFSAEAANNFQLGLHICCFGVTYERPWRFRSRAYVQGAAPIKVSDFKALYLEDSEKAIRILTQKIEETTSRLVVDAENREQDQLLGRLEAIHDSEMKLQKVKLSPTERLARAQRWAKELSLFAKGNQNSFDIIRTQIENYFASLDENKLIDEAVAFPTFSVKLLLIGLLLLPIALIGCLINILPYGLTEWLWQKMKLEGYEATVRIVAGGLIILPICYTLEINLLSIYFTMPFLNLTFWFMGIFSGIIAWEYWQNIKIIVAKILIQLRPKTKTQLNEQRNQIIYDLKNLPFWESK